MKPSTVVDEMFPDGVGGPFIDDEYQGPSGSLTVDSNCTREGIHLDFNRDFGDLFDDDDIA